MPGTCIALLLALSLISRIIFPFRRAGWPRQPRELSRCLGGWNGSVHRLLGQLPPNLELTDYYHHHPNLPAPFCVVWLYYFNGSVDVKATPTFSQTPTHYHITTMPPLSPHPAPILLFPPKPFPQASPIWTTVMMMTMNHRCCYNQQNNVNPSSPRIFLACTIPSMFPAPPPPLLCIHDFTRLCATTKTAIFACCCYNYYSSSRILVCLSLSLAHTRSLTHSASVSDVVLSLLPPQAPPPVPARPVPTLSRKNKQKEM